MNKRLALKFIVSTLFLLCSSSLRAQTLSPEDLSYQYLNYDKYRIETTNNQDTFENQELKAKNVILKNNIIVEILKRNADNVALNYDIERVENGKLMSEESSKYIQFFSGEMSVPQQYNAPYLRNIPQFPNTTIKVGDTWKTVGYENLQYPEANYYTLIEVVVDYQYLGVREIPSDAKDIALKKNITLVSPAPLIQLKYNIKDKQVYNSVIDEDQILNASFDILVWWNLQDKRIEYYQETYAFEVIYVANDDNLQFKGRTHGFMFGVEELNNDITKLQESLPDIKITKSDKGITFNLENIQFLADSAILQETEKAKLHAISDTLKDYPNRRILIEGHTALAGLESTRAVLSAERAKTVLDYLQNITNINKDLFLYRGWGAKKPLADNATERGREQNRRVEITILEN